LSFVEIYFVGSKSLELCVGCVPVLSLDIEQVVFCMTLFCHSCLATTEVSQANACPNCQSELIELVDETSGYDAVDWHRVQGSDEGQLNLHDLIRREIEALRTPHSFGGFGDERILRELMHRTLLEHQPRSQRTPDVVIDALERRTSGLALHECSEECVVCQESMREDASEDRNLNLLKLPCGHWFHDFCIRPWLEQCQTCPTCRTCVA
jgi:hypothetical protein